MSNKRFIFKCFITCVIIASFVAVSFPVLAAPVRIIPPIVTVEAGETWVVSETTSLNVLTIEEGATITAPEGKSLTLTVNGVETGIEPGTYWGNIVLTVTDDIIVQYQGFGGQISEYKFRAGIYVEDGLYVPEKSVEAAVRGGKVTDDYAENVQINSVGPKFNGIIVIGDSEYYVRNPKIDFTGNGGNDFAGYGTAIVTDGNAELTIDKATIIADGVIRNAGVIKGNSTLTLNDCYVHTGSPPLPEVIEGMMCVPWMLGLTGTCRSFNMIEYGTLNVNNCHIIAEGWGALSTDATKKVRMNVKDSVIEVRNSGYGSYSIGDSVNTFDECEFNVADMALIMANEVSCGVFTNGSVVNSGRFGVMMHSGNVGTLTIDEGSVFNTEEAVILVKSSYSNIEVDNAELNSGNGIILQAMVNDDPYAGVGVGDEVNASFSNMILDGDIVNSMTSLADLIVNLDNVTITGAISTATVETEAERRGIDLTTIPPFSPEGAEYAYLIGWVHNTYCDPDETYGLIVSLDEDSTWVVDETSYLTGLTIADGAEVTAPEGYSVTMTVDGTPTPIEVGTYTGKIVLTVVAD